MVDSETMTRTDARKQINAPIDMTGVRPASEFAVPDADKDGVITEPELAVVGVETLRQQEQMYKSYEDREKLS